ncbi:hypothetical protein [Runella sp.]|jgi:catechol 2,3-dioxygenase-like lactoylglutathione lyase family enzyme|uniref:VOC family protein n=1 Tax=Runella sp. TaxID=1960881 RepID=UPI003015D841
MDILEIQLLTDNLEETEHFYSNLVGLPTKQKDATSISFMAGQSTLTFLQSTELNPTYHFAFNIPKNQIESATAWVAERFELILGPDNETIANFVSWNAKAVYFYDNNGNILEFIARFDFDNASDRPFSTSSILSVSEIGLVTDVPMAYAKQLVDKENLSYFSKSPESEAFVVLGDDNGLLIVVKNQRNWYPTQQQAQKQYTKIKLAVNGLLKEVTVNDENTAR